jgi:hypothetical protein
MAFGRLGVDSLNPVSGAPINVATQVLKTAPGFWGRYFTYRGDPDPGQYQRTTESHHFADNGFRLLPYARQTHHVGGTRDQGISDGIRNAEAFVDALTVPLLRAQGGKFCIFLDVEREVPLSKDYYTGWSEALTARGAELSDNTLELLPCVYLNLSDANTGNTLNAAIVSGAKCEGLSVARYYSATAHNYPGPFPWDPNFLKPAVPLIPPIVIWQYLGDYRGVDAAQINPALNEKLVLEKLAQP